MTIIPNPVGKSRFSLWRRAGLCWAKPALSPACPEPRLSWAPPVLSPVEGSKGRRVEACPELVEGGRSAGFVPIAPPLTGAGFYRPWTTEFRINPARGIWGLPQKLGWRRQNPFKAIANFAKLHHNYQICLLGQDPKNSGSTPLPVCDQINRISLQKMAEDQKLSFALIFLTSITHPFSAIAPTN